MRKITTTLLALMCVICCMFGLVACDDEPASSSSNSKTTSTGTTTSTTSGNSTTGTNSKTDSKTEESTSSNSTTTSSNSSSSSDSTSSESSSSSDSSSSGGTTPDVPETNTNEVTAQQWSQILSGVENYTIKMYQGDVVDMVAKFDGATRSEKYDEEEGIITIDGDVCYYYFFDGTSWKRSVMSADQYSDGGMIATFITLFKNDYSLFTYENGMYTADSIDKTESLGTGAKNVKVAFKNGALVSMEFVVNHIGTFKINNIGTTTVELPTEFIVAEVSAQQWKQVLGTTDNFEIEISSGIGGILGNITIDGAMTSIQFDGEQPTQSIFTTDGGNYYEYVSNYNGTSWKRKTITQDYYLKSKLYAGFVSMFADDYNLFTNEYGVYKAASIDKTELLGTTVKNVKVTFGNGLLVGLQFDMDGITYTIKNIGGAEIVVPTEYDVAVEALR